MQLETLFVRFYKAFNYDYELREDYRAKRIDWQFIEEVWYPFVSVRVEPDITAVVGANESGKSQLLLAVEFLLTGETPARSAFCRYSPLYSVEADQRRDPDFGGRFKATSEEDRAFVALMEEGVESFDFYRPGDGADPYIVVDADSSPRALSTQELAQLQGLLPLPFKIDTKVALPDAIPYSALTGDGSTSWKPSSRHGVLDLLATAVGGGEQALANHLPALYAQVLGADTPTTAEIKLARQLILEIAKIDPLSVKDLAAAVRDSEGGETGGLVQRMDDKIATALNFPKWWVQDSEFKLKLHAGDYELGLTVEDRTGTRYSFNERSTGLQYFLSYYIQMLAHKRPEGRSEILLLDEPDAYLSGTGQQDLLRLLENYAVPADVDRNDQVVYVTHSPFMINKNAGHRIRVLDKGIGEEGTRVVHDATQQHYEPLRSSIGPYVAETAFIGGANIFVEGTSDQVLLAGFSGILRRSGASESSCLDLNKTTIVSAGSATSIPYFAYLARGRDQVKPPCIALFDGDTEGHREAKRLRKHEVSGSRVLDDQFVVLIDEWALEGQVKADRGIKLREIEDLLSVPLATAAMQNYARHYLRASSEETAQLDAKGVRAGLRDSDGSLFDAACNLFLALFQTKLSKIGFAKEVVHLVERDNESFTDVTARIAQLIAHLAQLSREAVWAEDDKRQARQVNSVITGFLREHAEGARKNDASTTLDLLLRKVDDADERGALAERVKEIRAEHQLAEASHEFIADHEQFKKDLDQLRTLWKRKLRTEATS
jgi:predicted ATPase